MQRKLFMVAFVVAALVAAGLLVASGAVQAMRPDNGGRPALAALAAQPPAKSQPAAPLQGTPTPTATATACPPVNLVVNGGFETGAFPPWTVDSSAPAPFIATSGGGYPVHSGSDSAHVG